MSSELDGLCCPLTLEVFEDPCTLVGDGHTYERASIQAWLDSGKLTSPTTGATLGLGGTRLVPNYAVKRTIAELAARGRLPPTGTPPRLATEVSQVTSKLNEALRDRNSLLDENVRLKKLMENRAIVLDAQADLAAQKGPAPGAGTARGEGDTALAAEVARKDEVIRLLERNLASMQKVHSASQGALH